MLYPLAKVLIWSASKIYCSRLNYNHKNLYNGSAPLILACNHPNSFLDSIVLGAYHRRPLHFLARGDAFKNPRAAKIMRGLNMIPIYRISEGKENLDNNKQTFKECMEVFKKKGVILIFSEGVSINEWKLRPLKKGTARIAWMCWKEHGITDMVVQPTGINYNSFDGPPKVMDYRFAPTFGMDEFELNDAPEFYWAFNERLKKDLEPLVLDKDHADIQQRKNPLKKFLIAIPAIIGYLLHRPLYAPWKKFIKKKTKGTVFYDSVMFTSLMLMYPILVFLVTLLTVILTGNAAFWSLFLLLPFTAWCYKEYKAI